MAEHMTAEQLRELIESAQALADSLPRGDILRYYCRKNELTRLRMALDAARLSGMAAAPNFCEECAGRIETCDCVQPRPARVQFSRSTAATTPSLSAQELRDLRRFAECCEDDDAEGHDVPKDRMKRLAKIGVVRNCGFGRHETTEYGDAILATAPEPPHV